ncbi:O-antigen ligase family protein [Prosthecobacter dejongeii]|uniref:O-antigen ligase n=1 Tax=Prosthecobacter dejongeii TaxID=48465 RepID=A0A7W7YPI1_9BACT|nr:O-antigen ligase family protein [Prosthecobacter dejongeii]MBB5039958.1 O-antigen ligase [Prosthecobacter dejongeii]
MHPSSPLHAASLQAHPGALAKPDPLVHRMVVWICGTILGLLAADVVIGLYNAGISPLKPSLYTVVVVAGCIGLSALSGIRFAPVSLLVLLLPAVRLFDAALLSRSVTTLQNQAGMDHLRIMLIILATLAVLSTTPGMNAVRWAAILAIFMTTGSEVAEMLGLAKFSSINGRFAGFNSHPNFPPVLLCEMLGITFALCRSFKLNCLLIAVSFVGVALTYGRSGFVVLALMCTVYILQNARRNLPFLLLMAAIAIPAAGVGFAILQSRTEQGVVKDKNTSDRLQAIYELDFEKLKSPERAQDLAHGWEGVMQKPLLGHGTGVSGVLYAPHNEYVSILLELGIPGLLLFVGTLGALVVRSFMTGGKAGYLLFAIIAYTPAGQGRIEMPHYYLALATAAFILWPQRFRIVVATPASPATP